MGLIISRYKGQSFLIGDDVEVEIKEIDCDRGQVQININAPRHIEVDRKEVRDRKRGKTNDQQNRK